MKHVTVEQARVWQVLSAHTFIAANDLAAQAKVSGRTTRTCLEAWRAVDLVGVSFNTWPRLWFSKAAPIPAGKPKYVLTEKAQKAKAQLDIAIISFQL